MPQTSKDKAGLIEKGKKLFGDDFFMVDPRGEHVMAAPFRICTDKDVFVFVNYASPVISWVASKGAHYEKKVMVAHA